MQEEQLLNPRTRSVLGVPPTLGHLPAPPVPIAPRLEIGKIPVFSPTAAPSAQNPGAAKPGHPPERESPEEHRDGETPRVKRFSSPS